MISAGQQATNPDHWRRIKELLNAALELDPAERNPYLDACCGEDFKLREELSSLIASYEQAGEFLDSAVQPPADDSRDPVLGVRIGPYKLLQEIGRGGMGSVYRAIRANDLLRQEVAIKLIRRGMDHEHVLQRFESERQILAALEHPNIARVLDGGATDEGLPYFVMEYIHGKCIDEHSDANRLTTRERLGLFRLVCSALHCAHERNIVHRDIKPGNILIDEAGQPKLLDFGIAKILDPESSDQTVDPTATVLRLMTPEYASPEQVRGDAITPASDVYSLGVLLYELLTGHKPYRLKSRSAHEMAFIICEGKPERPSTAVSRTELVTRGSKPALNLTPLIVSSSRSTEPENLHRLLCGDLDNVVLKAMRKEPERRYQTAAAFADDIQRYLDNRPVRARRDTLFYRTARTVKRNRAATALAGLAVVLALAFLAALRRFEIRPTEPAAAQRILPLTSFPGDETQPAFSRDGERVAFVWSGENGDNSDIYVKGVSTGPLLRLTKNEAEDVSPTWSPDGRRIAFLRTSEKETAVFIAQSDGGGIHGKIADVYPTRIEAVGKHLDWSPDGKLLAAADKSDPEEPFNIVLIDVGTGQKKRITAPPRGTIGDSSPTFSPDGSTIAFIRAASSGVDDIYTVAVTGGEVKRITTDRRYIISLAWASDARAVLFSSNRSGNHSLWRASLDGAAPERVPAIGENTSDPVFAQSKRRMAYTQFYVDTNIWRVDAAGGTPRVQIASTQYDSSPQYSPDGTRIAFRSTRSGYNEVWLADADGKNPTQLTSFSNTLTGTPRWSPDGKWIACDSRPEGQPDIFLIEVATGVARRLTQDPAEDVVPSWSRDGRFIYFASVRTGTWQVWRTPVGEGAPEQVTHNGGFAAWESPDQKYLYYAKGRSVPGLWRKALPGGIEELVLERLKAGYWGYWAICKGEIFFADRLSTAGPARIYAYDLEGKTTKMLATMTKPPIVADSALAISPDCQTLLFAQVDQRGSDIMLVENYAGAR